MLVETASDDNNHTTNACVCVCVCSFIVHRKLLGMEIHSMVLSAGSGAGKPQF